MSREQARANLEAARAEVRAVQDTITLEDSFLMLQNRVETVELMAKQMAQKEALQKVINAQEELRAAN